MLIGNVPPTAYDLRFSLLGIHVRVNPLFWLVSLLMGMNLPPRQLVLWIPVVFVSILIHEMGHALMVRQFGWRPSILLYSIGGLAMYQPTHHDSRKEMLISLAGPAAGFLFAGAILASLQAAGRPVHFTFGAPEGIRWELSDLHNDNLNFLVDSLLFVNIWWGLVNLLPVFPLDGGQFTRELLYWQRVPEAIVKSLWISIFVAACVAFYAVAKLHTFYMGAMFGYLAYTSYQALQAFTGRGGGYGGW